VPEEERIRHLAACDIAVFPSKYEPFGIVALEAMAMEKPVIVGASGVSGLREIVVPSGDYWTGVHVNGQNPADIFGWGLKPLLSLSTEELIEMGKRGRRRAEEYFTWTRIAKQTAEIYTQTIEIHKEHLLEKLEKTLDCVFTETNKGHKPIEKIAGCSGSFDNAVYKP
ncbi:MAG: glycosyltransferase family 4 protein, partial [Methanotrichaceae archaeon]|nr:glycosyltransferase family 4 protein [Methanotrichaceae archaeon]